MLKLPFIIFVLVFKDFNNILKVFLKEKPDRNYIQDVFFFKGGKQKFTFASSKENSN